MRWPYTGALPDFDFLFPSHFSACSSLWFFLHTTTSCFLLFVNNFVHKLNFVLCLSFTCLCLFLSYSGPCFYRTSSLKEWHSWLQFGRCWFQYRAEHRLTWLRLFVVYLRLGRHVTDSLPKAGHGSPLGVATRLRAGRPTNCRSIPDRPRGFVFCIESRLYVKTTQPPSSGCMRLFPGG